MPVAGTSASAAQPEEPIRVVVTPSQASYFAGETFSVTITITNVRTQEAALPVVRSASHSASHHKRGAHSVSSVPMARPPTSPVGRSALPQLQTEGKQVTEQKAGERRGLIGTRPATDALKGPGERKRPVLAKSLSLSIAPHEFETKLKEDVKRKSPIRAVRSQDAYSCE